MEVATPPMLSYVHVNITIPARRPTFTPPSTPLVLPTTAVPNEAVLFVAFESFGPRRNFARRFFHNL